MQKRHRFRKLRWFYRKVGWLRIIGGLIVLFLSLKLLAACASPPVHLSLVVSRNEAEYWRPLIAQFEAKHPAIQIDLANDVLQVDLDDADQIKNAYVSAFKEGKPYDLIYMDIIWVPEFASQSDWLMELTSDFPLDELRKDFLISEVENGLVDDMLYRIPFRTDAGILYYRKDLLAQVGEDPPQTFQDLIRIAKKIQTEENAEWGYLWQGQKSEAIAAMFMEVLYGYGGFWVDDQRTVGLDQPEAIDAVKFLLTTTQENISPTDIANYQEQRTREAFRDGNVVFMRNWPYVWKDANGPDSSVRGKIAIQPMVHVQGRDGFSCKGGWGFGVAKHTQHPTEAVEAVKFFTSAASQRQFSLSYGALPSRRRLFFDPQIVARYNYYPELLNLMDSKRWIPRPRIPEYAQASCILQKHLSTVLNPQNGYPDPEGAMRAAAQETRQLLNTGELDCISANR